MELRRRLDTLTCWAPVGKPHLYDHHRLEWEDVYKGWSNDDLKYYWKRAAFKQVPRYDGYRNKGFAEALR